jgi:hypothetical protein
MRILFVVIVGVLLGAAGCKKKTQPTSTPTEQPAPSPGVRGNTNYVPGGGAVQNVRQAARRVVTLADMNQIALAIATWESENNRMPNYNQAYAIVSQYPNYKKLVDDGDVILTGTNNRSGMWAYEVEGDTKGGVAIIGGTASRQDAATIKQYLGQ